MRISLLILVVVCASVAAAAPVNPNSPDGVAAVHYNDAWMYALCTDGRVFLLQAPSQSQAWQLIEDHLPVPVAEMAEWSLYFIRTTGGAIWRGDPQLGSDNWTLAPAIPCEAPVPAQGHSLGGVKGLFR